jgi:hypothetical protein
MDCWCDQCCAVFLAEPKTTLSLLFNCIENRYSHLISCKYSRQLNSSMFPDFSLSTLNFQTHIHIIPRKARDCLWTSEVCIVCFSLDCIVEQHSSILRKTLDQWLFTEFAKASPEFWPGSFSTCQSCSRAVIKHLSRRRKRFKNLVSPDQQRLKIFWYIVCKHRESVP